MATARWPRRRGDRDVRDPRLRRRFGEDHLSSLRGVLGITPTRWPGNSRNWPHDGQRNSWWPIRGPTAGRHSTSTLEPHAHLTAITTTSICPSPPGSATPACQAALVTSSSNRLLGSYKIFSSPTSSTGGFRLRLNFEKGKAVAM